MRHEKEITACLLRLSDLAYQITVAAQAHNRERVARLTTDYQRVSARLDALRRDVPLRTSTGRITGRRVNHQPSGGRP